MYSYASKDAVIFTTCARQLYKNKIVSIWGDNFIYIKGLQTVKN
jgi:hypothetical protein